MTPKVLHLSTYDANGGAARAAYALHRAMVAEGLDSSMRVAVKTLSDPNVTGPRRARVSRFSLAQEADRRLWKVQRSSRKTWRSPAFFGTLSATEVNRSDADVVNLHWVTDGFLSIKEIGRIEKPIVWSLYDMWPFAGTEHYGADEVDARWKSGYPSSSRPSDEHGIDLDRMTWRRKSRSWDKPMTMVPASSWLSDRLQSSALMGAWPARRIPHIVDCEQFSPVDSRQARSELGLPQDIPLVLFLASAGVGDQRKGWDLLDAAMVQVKVAHPDVEIVVVGPPDLNVSSKSGSRIHWTGQVDSDRELALHYSASSVTSVPSREDNMPLTAMEAQSCGRPVVAFNIGGLPDIVMSGSTGYLAAPFRTDELAEGLIRSIDSSLGEDHLGANARARAIATWSAPVVVEQYAALYEGLLRP